jgi:hypothetical protein
VARLSEIPTEARRLIDLLIEQRLLSTDVAAATKETTIEPAHEALLRQWRSLQGWLKEDAALLTVLDGIKRAARDWAANGKAGSWLTHTGARLRAAERLLTRPDFAANLEPTEKDYVASCTTMSRRAFLKAAAIAGATATAGLGLAALTPGVAIAAITTIVTWSDAAKINWDRKFPPPAGYLKGMALVFARAYLKLKSGNAAALDMAKADTGDSSIDALAWYSSAFAAAGMNNAVSGADTMRHLFVLLIGLGISESNGRFCEGLDPSASNTTAQTGEAGLFQTSFNSIQFSPLLMEVFKEYLAHQSGFVDIFREGVDCSGRDFAVAGSGENQEFQRLSKACPAFAVEYAAVGLRHGRAHWGPINRRQAQVRPECDAMLRHVQRFVDVWPTSYSTLVPSVTTTPAAP